MESAEAIFAGYRKSLSMIQLWKEKSELKAAFQDALRDEEIEAMMLARPPMKESSRSSALHSPTEWAVCKLEKMDAAMNRCGRICGLFSSTKQSCEP